MNHRSSIKSKEWASKVALTSIVLLSLTYVVTLAHAKKGGVLYVYDDIIGDWVGVEKQFDVLPCNTYLIQVREIPSELGDVVIVKVSNEDTWTRWRSVVGGVIEFEWHCPEEAEYCTTYVVQLKKAVPDTPYEPSGAEYTVEGILTDGKQFTAHLHVIPEFTFGTAMAILSLFSGLGVYSKFRRK